MNVQMPHFIYLILAVIHFDNWMQVIYRTRNAICRKIKLKDQYDLPVEIVSKQRKEHYWNMLISKNSAGFTATN